MTNHEFTCANCGVTLMSEWSSDDAMQEYLETFTDEHVMAHSAEQMETICDDCYDRIMARIRAEAPKLLRDHD